MTNDQVYYIASAKPGVVSNGDIVVPHERLNYWITTCREKFEFNGPFVLTRVEGKVYLPYDKSNEERFAELSQLEES